jgi:hypothetical protein
MTSNERRAYQDASDLCEVLGRREGFAECEGPYVAEGYQSGRRGIRVMDTRDAPWSLVTCFTAATWSDVDDAVISATALVSRIATRG